MNTNTNYTNSTRTRFARSNIRYTKVTSHELASLVRIFDTQKLLRKLFSNEAQRSSNVALKVILERSAAEFEREFVRSLSVMESRRIRNKLYLTNVVVTGDRAMMYLYDVRDVDAFMRERGDVRIATALHNIAPRVLVFEDMNQFEQFCIRTDAPSDVVDAVLSKTYLSYAPCGADVDVADAKEIVCIDGKEYALFERNRTPLLPELYDFITSAENINTKLALRRFFSTKSLCRVLFIGLSLLLRRALGC